MTETQGEQDVPISSERLLAAILNKLGKIELTVEEIMGDYSGCQIEVEQTDERVVSFSLSQVLSDESE